MSLPSNNCALKNKYAPTASNICSFFPLTNLTFAKIDIVARSTSQRAIASCLNPDMKTGFACCNQGPSCGTIACWKLNCPSHRFNSHRHNLSLRLVSVALLETKIWSKVALLCLGQVFKATCATMCRYGSKSSVWKLLFLCR